MKTNCMSCRYYRIEDEQQGRCRVEAKRTDGDSPEKAVVRHDHSCGEWVDCGQQYFIRIGWLKARKTTQAYQKT